MNEEKKLKGEKGKDRPSYLSTLITSVTRDRLTWWPAFTPLLFICDSKNNNHNIYTTGAALAKLPLSSPRILKQIALNSHAEQSR